MIERMKWLNPQNKSPNGKSRLKRGPASRALAKISEVVRGPKAQVSL